MTAVAARLLLNPVDDLLKLRDDIALRHWQYTVKTGNCGALGASDPSRANGVAVADAALGVIRPSGGRQTLLAGVPRARPFFFQTR